MSDHQPLEPITTKTVTIYSDEVTAVMVDIDGQHTVYVPIRPLCDYLGLDWSSQRKRLNRDQVLSESLRSVVIMTTDLPSDSTRPRTSEMICLPLSLVNGWLFGVDANRVKPELKQKILVYQRECYNVLAAAFLNTDIAPSTSAEQRILIQVRETALAIAEMAQQQLALTTRLDKAAIVVGEHGRRITTLEQQLAPRNAITDEQAADIAETVKALALLMGEHDKSKSHFQQIFSELYRRFRVSSYKLIRQSQYQLVMAFLDEWYESLKGADNS